MVEQNNEGHREAPRPAEAPEPRNNTAAPDFRADNLLADGKTLTAARDDAKPNPLKDNKIEFPNVFNETGAKGNTAAGSDWRTRAAVAMPTDGRALGALDTAFGTARNDLNTTNFSVSGDLSKLDPKKPTVAFLDSRDVSIPLDGQNLTHADVSALAAQKNGFNALVLDKSQDRIGSAFDTFSQEFKKNPDQAIAKAAAQLGDDKLGLDKLNKKDLLGAATILGHARHDSNFAPSLNEIANNIESGKLPLGKGDVLNVSMGDNAYKDAKGNPIPGTGDPTFAELSKKLGFEVNADNLDASKDKILNKLEDIAKDPSDKEWQELAQKALDTNKAIGRLQDLGLEVAHSASNDGNDRVDISFLKANYELKSVDPQTGKLDKFSGNGNVQGDGIVPIYRKQIDATTKYAMSGVEFTHEDIARVNGDFKFSPVAYKPQSYISIADRKVESNQDKLEKLVGDLAGRTAPAVKTKDGELAAVAIGNSFVNVQFLQTQHDRLQAKKQDRASSIRS